MCVDYSGRRILGEEVGPSQQPRNGEIRPSFHDGIFSVRSCDLIVEKLRMDMKVVAPEEQEQLEG